MNEMADTQRLLKRGETYHYHRRVPLHLVDIIGKKFIRRSLGTDSPREARRLRTMEDARTELMFRDAEMGIKPNAGRAGVSLEAFTAYVRDTVEEMDRQTAERFALSPPADKQSLTDLLMEAEFDLSILADITDPRQEETVAWQTDRIAHANNLDLTDTSLLAEVAEIVRRGLIEVARRRIGRLTNENGKTFHDAIFDPDWKPSVPASIPFIDRISVTLKVPTVDDAVSINSNIWSQFDDVAVFHSAKKGPSYRVAKRIKLPSVIDAAKWPFFQYDYDGDMATGFRIEFVPADVGHQGLLELHSILTTLMPNGWAYFIEHGRITRIDIALDMPTARMEEFHFLPMQGATTSAWKSNGKLQTFQHGKPKGNHTQIYNRKAKRIAQGKSWKGKEGIRIERRLKGQQLALKELPGLPNPFASMALIERHPSQPPTEKKEYVWALFLNAAEYMGIPAALALLPEERRTTYRAHLKTEKLKWWDADAIWKNWSVTIDGLEISTLKSWS